MTSPNPSFLALLEPGALQSGALFRSLIAHASKDGLLPPGTRLGPFRIAGELGAGGMGVVYRAERDDGQYRQQVAIKCVASAVGADSLALFRRERQILAEMRHPHIARLLDGGQLDDGRLWFAMELVTGACIDAHARSGDLSVAARIGLLRQVCQAVAFAHQRLLLHRDIKPGNVLIDADGSVKLLDFGIAALVGDREATRAYSPGWASPEQLADGEIGPASDQYQLGLLLDALLRAGPSEGVAGSAESGRPALDPGPSRIQPECWLPMPAARRAELRSIVARATAAGADARYGSVVDLDAELARWLAGRPVAAHSSGVGYTLMCAVRRHPLVTAASSAAVIAMVALVLGFNWRLAAERDHAQAEATRATREAQAAAAVSRFLQDDLLALADPNTSQDADLKVKTLLDRAGPTVDKRLAEQPEIAAAIHATLARSLRGLGDFAAAEVEFTRAQALLATLTEDDPKRLQLDLWHGDLDLARSDASAAYQRLQHVAEVAARGLGANSQLALEAATRAAAARFELGQQQAAIDALTALMPRLDALLGPDAPLPIYALNRLAIMYNTVERIEDSERVRAEHLARATRAYGALHSTTLTGRLNRAVLLRKLGRTAEALSEAQAAEEGLRKVFGNPSVAALHAMNVRSRILQDSQRLDEAIVLQRQTLAGRIALLGPSHDDVAYSHVNLGGMLMQAHAFDEAMVEFQRALEIRETLLGPDHVDVITNLTVMADTERMRGNNMAALGYASDAVTRARRALAGDRPELASTLFRYAQVLAALKRNAQAREIGAEALAIYAHIYPAEHPRVVAAQRWLDELPQD